MLKVTTEAPLSWKAARVERLPLLQKSDGQAVGSVSDWLDRKAELAAAWRTYLGEAPYNLNSNIRLEAEEDLGYCKAQLVYIETEPNYYEKCYLMVPKGAKGKRPAVVVFYYDVGTPAGRNMGSPRWQEGEERAFAKHLVERGFVVLVQRWFYEGYIWDQNATQGSLAVRYAAAVEQFKRMAPDWKGLGRVVWDASRCVDFLLTLPYVDPARIGCMGHSLGGKMALYAAAFDPRFTAVVSSELGIGLSYSNWDAPWYLGPEVKEPDFPLDHHQLLAMLAPRPFLLIAGEDADGDRSWPYLNSAQDVYELYGAADRIGMVNHCTGHSPTLDALNLAYDWLEKWLRDRELPRGVSMA